MWKFIKDYLNWLKLPKCAQVQNNFKSLEMKTNTINNNSTEPSISASFSCPACPQLSIPCLGPYFLSIAPPVQHISLEQPQLRSKTSISCITQWNHILYTTTWTMQHPSNPTQANVKHIQTVTNKYIRKYKG